MAQRRHHYERAFESYLRWQRIPYVAVDEARKALMPEGAGTDSSAEEGASSGAPQALKSFDFVLYAQTRNLLIDVKGRKVARRAKRQPLPGLSTVSAPLLIPDQPPRPAPRAGRLESWVTQDDIDSLRTWRTLFGDGAEAAFVFVFWCDEQPPDGLFQEVFDYQNRWYALRAITLPAYMGAMKPRSSRWRTVDLPTRAFERLSEPFGPPWVAEGGGGTGGDGRDGG